MRWILLFFIAVPLVEMLLLFKVAGLIGGLWTIGLVVLTAVLGVQILKRQGFSTLLRANQRLNRGQLPAQEVVEGFFLAFAGALLLTPGFITDTLGFLCLTPPVRRAMAKKFIDSGVLMSVSTGSGNGFFWTSQRSTGGRTGANEKRSSGSTTIEGEFYEESGSRLSRRNDDSRTR
ncbi:MAG: FxsA family protein [Gammaproteobacteria bacterium]|nr:FxsA family protein [Pseudomonadales bacterium]MCP5345599.1 FxsA family protein [Pseudomonadales bacterium]